MSRRIVVFAPNWLGDMVMALPALADVRRAWPDAAIDLAARPAILPIVPLVPGAFGSVLLESRRKAVAAVGAGRYDTALLLPNSFNAAWIAYAAGVPERWGYAHEGRSVLLTRAVAAPVRVHQAEYFQRLTTALGCGPGPLVPRLDLPADGVSAARALLEEAGWRASVPLVALAPGAAFGGAKKWPASSFAETIDLLAADGVRTVLVGAAADAAAGRDVVASVRGPRPPIDLIGKTSLPVLAGVLSACRALVTNDSGAMHFAAALGTDVTAIFGPTNEHETRPLGTGRMQVLHGDTWCRPCMLRECPLTQRCMRQVSAGAVVEGMRGRS